MPKLGPLYRAAALRLRVADEPALPERTLRVEGVAVDRAHLAEYHRVCGFRLRDELPATYPHVMAFPLSMALMTGPDFPFPLLGLVHVHNRISLLRALPSSAVFDLGVRAEALRRHDRGTQLDVVTTASVDGEPVWVDRSTYLRRHGDARPAKERERPDPPQPDAVWRVPKRTGPDYASVSGDRNPIHTSVLLAKVFGFPRTIAHGMWTKARCLAALEGRLPDRYTVDVAFKAPVLLPATVGFSATQDAAGWSFAVHSDRPHLDGTVSDAGQADLI